MSDNPYESPTVEPTTSTPKRRRTFSAFLIAMMFLAVLFVFAAYFVVAPSPIGQGNCTSNFLFGLMIA